MHIRVPALVLALATAAMLARVDPVAAQRATAPRLREGGVPARIPEAVGGGEVALALTVDASGAVMRIERLRVTPPYADLAAEAAGAWRFDPATAVKAGRREPIPASVLVLALFRPPAFYAGSTLGAAPQDVGAPPPGLPRVQSMAMPAYPPNGIGDRIVLVEIEMTGRAEPRAYRIVSPSSGFDSAALDAVRAWRFEPPTSSEVPEPLFVYALVGFRVPLAPAARQP